MSLVRVLVEGGFLHTICVCSVCHATSLIGAGANYVYGGSLCSFVARPPISDPALRSHTENDACCFENPYGIFGGKTYDRQTVKDTFSKNAVRFPAGRRSVDDDDAPAKNDMITGGTFLPVENLALSSGRVCSI
jgi:hypothetical protein